MSTPITEAQYQLAHQIRQSSTQESAARLIADSQAQAVANLQCVFGAVAVERTELRAERDQLRAALALGQDNGDDAYDELRADCAELRADVVRLTTERDQLRAEVEPTDVIYQRACEVEHELRAEVERWRSAETQSLVDSAGRPIRFERSEAAQTVALAKWNGALERAMKAEAEVERLRSDRDCEK
jgi:hypothetical protein